MEWIQKDSYSILSTASLNIFSLCNPWAAQNFYSDDQLHHPYFHFRSVVLIFCEK